jgi:hypothetical protein
MDIINPKREYLPSLSLLNSSSSLTSKKIINSNDESSSSFCHTVYITVKKRRTTSPLSHNYEHSQLLLLPDIYCATPASKLSV